MGIYLVHPLASVTERKHPVFPGNATLLPYSRERMPYRMESEFPLLLFLFADTPVGEDFPEETQQRRGRDIASAL